jgi:hypothetical protein
VPYPHRTRDDWRDHATSPGNRCGRHRLHRCCDGQHKPSSINQSDPFLALLHELSTAESKAESVRCQIRKGLAGYLKGWGEVAERATRVRSTPMEVPNLGAQAAPPVSSASSRGNKSCVSTTGRFRGSALLPRGRRNLDETRRTFIPLLAFMPFPGPQWRFIEESVPLGAHGRMLEAEL